jgi:hypothetical protein
MQDSRPFGSSESGDVACVHGIRPGTNFPTPSRRIGQSFLPNAQRHQHFVVGEVRQDALGLHGLTRQIVLDAGEATT